MISSAHPGVGAVFCHPPHALTDASTSTTAAPAVAAAFVSPNSSSGSCSPPCAFPLRSGSSPRRRDRRQPQRKRRIEARGTLEISVQSNGELHQRRVVERGSNLGSTDSQGEGEVWQLTKNTYTSSQLDDAAAAAVTPSRRNLLSSALGVAIASFTTTGGGGGREASVAEAAVSQRVRLKDVEDQKLQDALRAAVAGDLENAEILFTELIKDEPQSASVWSNRGSVRISLGKYEQATTDFTKAIELAPEAPVPYLNRAISYEAQGLFNEAIADCKAAIVNDPEEPAAWFNLGNVQARLKDYDSSLLAYQKASVLAPGIAGYRLKQALVLFQVGRLEEAKKLIQGLVRKYPNYTEAHAALAAVLWNEGQRSKAEEQFSVATNLEPLYNKISWVESELLWPPGMVQAFARFLSIDYSKSAS